jgi:hypothetical protein
MANPNIDWNSAAKDYGVVNFTNDNDLVVTFFMKSVIDPIKSREQSIRIYSDMAYVKIFRPGEMLNVIERPMEENDKRRWPRQYENFLHNRTQVPEGTPIDLLFPNNPSVADNLRARGVYTIQQCANLTAHAIDSIGMGAQEYVNRAKKYLEAASSGSEVIKLQEALKNKDTEVFGLTQRIKDLEKMVNGLTAKLASPGQINPVSNTVDIPQVPGYDAQTARINSTHKTNELKKGKRFEEVVNKNVIDETDFDD